MGHRRLRDGWTARTIVVGLLVLAGVATADAVRGRGVTEPVVDPGRPRLPVEELRRAGVRGVLVYADARCELHALRLPGGDPARIPAGSEVGCSFVLSPDGERVAPGGAEWTRTGERLYALCEGDTVSVHAPPGLRPRYEFAGCAPGWRPGREPWQTVLTVARGTRILAVRPGCDGPPPCEEELLSRDAVFAAASRHPAVGGRNRLTGIDVVDLVWLSPRHAAVLVRLHVRTGRSSLVAFFDDGRLGRVVPLWDDRLRSLEPSPSGEYVLAEPGLALHTAGSTLELEPLVGRVRAAAWSTDESWIAVATAEGVALVPTAGFGGPAGRVLRLPVDALEIAWHSG